MTKRLSQEQVSEFCRSLQPIGRILEDPDYNVWCCSPIYGPDGKVHVFYSRWLNKYDHAGWLSACEVAHAVADKPEGPYMTIGVALQGSGGSNWDSWSIHNPTVHQVGNRYVMLYMGNDGSQLGITRDDILAMTEAEFMPYWHKLLETKRVGMAIAHDLYGPWERVGNTPIVDSGIVPSWDDYVTSNPAFVITPDGKYRIYYKGWDYESYASVANEAFQGNRKYGFAEAERLEGPYTKYVGNPVIDFSHIDPEMQCEDAYVWHEDDKYKVILRDMGFYNHEYGLYMQSADGFSWGEPEIAYRDAPFYFDEALPGISRQGRFERPQLLMKEGRPQYLFGAYRGGKYNTSSAVVLKIGD